MGEKTKKKTHKVRCCSPMNTIQLNYVRQHNYWILNLFIGRRKKEIELFVRKTGHILPSGFLKLTF